MATNSVTAVELVLGDGTQLRASADENPDVFWAVRGGGGNFGIVTAMEFKLFDIATVYAGMLMWDQQHAAKVLPVWAKWTESAPDCVTTSFRLLNLPPLPELPEFIRGRQLVVIDGAVLAEDDEAEGIIAELRALEPELDTFARVPAASIVRLHMDPEDPTPGVSDSTILADLPEAAIATYLEKAGPGSGSTLLAAELRQLGGALARPAEGARRAADAGREVRPVRGRGRDDAGDGHPGAGRRHRLWSARCRRTPPGGTTSTSPSPRSTCGSPSRAETWRRLKGIRSAVDPSGQLLANHQVPRFYEGGVPAQ